MKKIRTILSVMLALLVSTSYADEGMWLLQLMKEQHAIDMMHKKGLNLGVDQLYHPNGTSLKDAVGIFGGGCTGEIISSEGLILTNHHCGYGFIQQHSSVEHDYLTDGFWAKSRAEELPTPGLKFTFIERIEDITDLVNQRVAEGKITESESFTSDFLKSLAAELHKKSDLKNKKGIEPQALPFFAGNKFYLFYKKIYSDVRMVAAPPSSIGKFGGEIDNWMWPRHTGDFSIFRIYADEKGEPAAYSEKNKPLQTKKHLAISLKGYGEGDYAMIMGFPGSTSRYLTVDEVKDRMYSINEPRIAVREARLGVLKELMDASDKTRIQYANKYAGSSNYWKNSIGMNKAIIDNDVLGAKAEQEKRFSNFAKEVGNRSYETVVGEIAEVMSELSPLNYERTALSESFLAGIEYFVTYRPFDELIEALEKGNKKKIEKQKTKIKELYDRIHNKDYDHAVDKKVALALFPLYAELTEADKRPAFYQLIEEQYKGDYAQYIEDMYERTIMSNEENLNKFLANPTVKAIEEDLSLNYARGVVDKFVELNEVIQPLTKKLELLHKTYVRGLAEMKQPEPSYPDANFTIRLTYGTVKSYSPRDGVHYDYYTTTNGVLEKDDPTTREFNVPEKLRELLKAGDFGRYALPNGDMPVCFLTTNDITGGNSGSPVLNANGELIGCAFDGNWESLSGDINFDDNLQRCINLDVRYVLFILDKLGGCGHLIDEMTIVE